MSDEQTTGPRRQFEPPPWEREQFEELARRREAERLAEEKRLEIAAEAAGLREIAGQDIPAEAAAALVEQREKAAPPAAEQAEAAAPTATPPGMQPEATRSQGAAAKPEVDVEATTRLRRAAGMLEALKAEEEPVFAAAWRVAALVGGVMVLGGFVLMFQGGGYLARIRTPSAITLFVPGVMMLTGMTAIGLGAWTIVRGLKRRGE